MDDSDLEEFSGIEEPKVLAKIKAILDEYRNDVQIIKELIQNADDAEATEMKILYEGRQLNKELPGEKEYRKFFRSPALAVYNNAVFAHEDWRGIKAIYVSVKKDDPLKVGRFGLGFKSVFHLTDYPCIISGQYALFINPMEEDSTKICAMIKLKNMPKWTKLNFKDVMVALTDLFGISEDVFNSGYYNGTLFWFPLRQIPSQLSDDIYTDEEISSLLNSFIHDSERSLLFLKTLCQIHVYCNLSVEKNMEVSQSVAKTDLGLMNVGRHTPHYVVEINDDDNTLQQKRRQLLQEFKSIGVDVQKQSKSWVFNVYVHTKKFSNGEKKESKARWLIVNYLKGGDLSEKMTRLLKDKHLGYPPIVAMAAAVHENGTYSNNSGHVFCYQPLPQHNESMTGLPVHINGFFALSQNRRQVSWPDVGENDIARNDKKIEWNITLVSEVLPNAYILLLMTLVKQSEYDKKFVHAAINTIPDLNIVDPNWKVLASSFLQLCKDKEILYSETGGGQWVRIHDAVFVDFRGYPELSRGSQKTVINLLQKDEIKVVLIPDYIVDSLKQTFDGLQFVSQEYLAEHMKTSQTYKQLPSSKIQDLLEYFSQDCSYHYLEGLELVPLADGTFATFSSSNQLFVESQDVIELFPGSAGSFVATKLRKKTKVWMMDQVEKGTSCLLNLTSIAVARLAERVLKENFDEERTVSIPQEDVVRWKKWIKGVWDLIQSRFMDLLDDFQRLPLFPYISEQNWDDVDEFKLLPLNSLILHLERVEEKGLLCKVFQWLSVTVVKFVPQWLSENVKRKFLWHIEMIGEMFGKVRPECINIFNRNIDGPEAACLLEFLSKKIDSKLEETAMCHLQKLHILRAHTTLTSSKLCCLHDQNAVYLGKDFPVKFPAVYIRLDNAFEQRFVIEYLGGKTVTELEIVTTSLEQCEQYTTDEIKRLMYWILSSETYFCIDSIQNKMREVSFVESKHGQTFKPCELFDPSEMFLQDLFRGKDFFPSDSIHAKEDFLKRLKILGLKGLDHIMADDLEMVASEVEKMSTNSLTFDEMKCKALLAVMEKRFDLIDKARMCDKRCILVKKDAIENYPRGLALRNRKSKPASLLCQPSDIKSVEFANIVGSVKFMIHCGMVPNVSHLFEWHTPPDIIDVVHHLFNIVESFDKKMKSQCLRMIVCIYEWLSKQDLKQVSNALNSRFGSLGNKYVWVGDGFHAPEDVFIDTRDYDIDMRPYVHNIPTETSELKCFFKGIGCNQYQTLKLYVETLNKIKVISGNEDKTISDSKLLNMTVEILNTVKAVFQDHPELNKDDLYFPVVHDEISGLMMQPTKKCTFSDSQWLTDMGLKLDDDVYYIHPNIPQSTAEALGVPSIHNQMLADAVPIEEWGQEEPLTRRLHALLKDGYVDGFSVAKELFQNADDARARKLWIMYDERENNESRSNLLSDGMAECQGPAIWVYNDAKFRESDFENITKAECCHKKR